MTEEQMQALLVAANGIDPRVQVNHPTIHLWGRVLGGKTYQEAWAAMMVYYERPAPPNRDRPAVDATLIRRIITEETERAVARQQAIEAPRAAEASDGWAHKSIKQRIRNTPEFQALFEEGHRQGNAERARNMEARNAA